MYVWGIVCMHCMLTRDKNQAWCALYTRGDCDEQCSLRQRMDENELTSVDMSLNTSDPSICSR